MELIRPTAGTESERSLGPFTGDIWRDMFHVGHETVVGSVHFTPCARTHWHRHPHGQLLIIVAGEGLVVDDEQTLRVSVGDMIYTPPGGRHWHGASADRFMMHTAITFGGGAVTWEDEVSNTEYELAAGVSPHLDSRP
ncbi:cupin domain-containing protein [Nocardioides pocheonensis]|uniref:Cupin domain-containing protein n=1 Tax=Nocardioides pocheonensis TaxID=661485 RepID=A0A3N0GJA3_9ACTN|nr:cupin domain-containing protein [Nocardioides pocheonensis]RNM12198.1 cupin domain-containing protein [Nocardioides pocheonensis]